MRECFPRVVVQLGLLGKGDDMRYRRFGWSCIIIESEKIVVIVMNSYGYNQERSIHRLDQLLNRNEEIYQNLKLKLDQINKSSSNIHRNINYINSFTQQNSQQFTHPPSLTDSSAVHQEAYHSDPFCITEPEQLGNHQSQHQENSMEEHTVDFGRNREIQEVLHRQRVEVERSRKWLKASRGVKQSITRQQSNRNDRTSHLEIQNLNITSSRGISHGKNMSENSNSPRVSITYSNSKALDLSHSHNEHGIQGVQRVETAYLRKSEVEVSSKNSKGNSIYLTQVAKIESVKNEELEDMPTFRQMFQREFGRFEDSEQPKKSGRTSHVIKSMESHAIQTDRSSSSLATDPCLQEISYNQPLSDKKYVKYSEPAISQGVEQRQNDATQIDFLATSMPRVELTSTEQKSPQWQKHCESYLFAPFNKVYRSPILQLKAGGQILLERRSKTSIHSRNINCDPIKFRFKHVVTDEQEMIRQLLQGSKPFSFGHVESNKVLIIGGRDTLKKKLHLGLLAYLLQTASLQVQNSSRSFFIKVEHKESGKENMVEAHIEVKAGSDRVAQLELERAGQDVSRSVIGGSKNEKVLRVTKISVDSNEGWTFSIISSNRIDSQFARCIGAGRVCWTINPLIKNYNDVHQTVETMQRFIRSLRQQ